MEVDDYSEHIQGFSLLDCTISRPDLVSFMAQEVPDTGLGISENDYDYRTRGISINLTSKRVSSSRWEAGFKTPKIIRTPDNGYLITSREGRAKETNDVPVKFPQYTLDTPEFRCEQRVEVTVNFLRKIDNEIYSCGFHHKLLKRVGKKQWIDLTNDQDHPELFVDIKAVRADPNATFLSVPYSFISFDGFNAEDIYACGSDGDLWHYNGKRWLQLSPPVNSELNNLVCGDDGFVYITSSWGDLLKGYYRDGEEKWELIPQNVVGMDLGFEDAAWFQGKLYLSNSWGLYVLENDVVSRVDFSDQGHNAQYSFKRVIADQGILISYGLNNAVMFDGQHWQAIINPHYLES